MKSVKLPPPTDRDYYLRDLSVKKEGGLDLLKARLREQCFWDHQVQERVDAMAAAVCDLEWTSPAFQALHAVMYTICEGLPDKEDMADDEGGEKTKHTLEEYRAIFTATKLLQQSICQAPEIKWVVAMCDHKLQEVAVLEKIEKAAAC